MSRLKLMTVLGTLAGGGGGGEKIAPGEVVFGGKNGTQTILDCNTLVDGSYQFYNKPYLVEFECDMPELTKMDYMFAYSPNLERVKITTGMLTSTSNAFYKCPNLLYLEGTMHGNIMIPGGTVKEIRCNFPDKTSGTYDFSRNTTLEVFEGDLSSLVSGATGTTYYYGMFYGCTKLKSVKADLSSLEIGGAIYKSSWSTEYNGMFTQCTALTSWDNELPKLREAYYMFQGCTALTSWSIELPNLEIGFGMFNGSGLTSWNIDLPKLVNGQSMFGTGSANSKLKTFSGNLDSLENGQSMFYYTNRLTTFAPDNLSKLSNGNYMFYTNHMLKSFMIPLPALSTGDQMFANCNIDLDSLTNIVTTLPTYTEGSHPITIGVDRNVVTQEQQNNANTILTGKGWTVTWQRNHY